MKIAASNNGVLTDFIYGTDDPRFKIDLHNCDDQKEQQTLSSVNEKRYIFLFLFLSCRSANVVRYT